ncbi:MAG: 2-oxoacid:acceptor oxidoreductase family protein [Armatimonadota bacterium]|jgi:2-oxoglutarate ferredoxin oxidoreductase subunit gamma
MAQPADRYEVRLSGSGGQGIITAGIILAEAAGVHEGKSVVQTQSYGPESRGGAARAEVVISAGEIDFPKVIRPNLLLAMTQEACDAYAGDLVEAGTALLDSTFVHDVPDGENIYAIPITQVARDQAGRAIVANIAALGIITAAMGIVSRDSMHAAVLARVPRGTEALNEKALEVGYALAEEHWNTSP